MPSAEDTTFSFEVTPETTQDFLTRDVDLLVSQIKENLRLTSLKGKRASLRIHRSSPYMQMHTRRLHCERYANNKKDNKDTEDNPYEKLRKLLEQGRLINEAVKKLQTMNCNDISSSNSEVPDDYMEEHDDDNGADLVAYRPYLYRKKKYYYDSEDEPLPGVYQPLDL